MAATLADYIRAGLFGEPDQSPRGILAPQTQSTGGGGILSGLFGGGDIADLYGDALTPAQVAAANRRRLMGGLQAAFAGPSYSLDPGKIQGPFETFMAGLTGGQGAVDEAAAQALKGSEFGLKRRQVGLQEREVGIKEKEAQTIVDAVPKLLEYIQTGNIPAAQGLLGSLGGGTGQTGAGGDTDRAARLVSFHESGDRPYIGVGGADLSKAPLDQYGFPQWAGIMTDKGPSHAAGLYQFQPGTWAKYAGPLGIKDFSPESQRKVFDAAYAAEGYAPWAPYNSRLAAALRSEIPAGGSGGSTAAAQPPAGAGGDQGPPRGVLPPVQIGSGQEPSGPMDVEARYKDAVRRGDMVRAQQILRGEPPSQSAPAPAGILPPQSSTPQGSTPQGSTPLPGAQPTAPAAPLPGVPQMPPKFTPAEAGAGPTGLDPMTRQALALQMLGSLTKMPGLGQIVTGSPGYQAAGELAKRQAVLPLIGQEATLKAQAEDDAAAQAQGFMPRSPEWQAAKRANEDKRPDAVRLEAIASELERTNPEAARRIREAMPGAAPTTDIKEYQAYAKDQQMRGQPVLSFNEWDLGRRKSSATSINTVEGMEAAQAKSRLAIDTKVATEANDLALQARRLMPLLEQVIKITDATPGGLSGRVAPFVAQTMSALNLPVPESMTNAELMASISQRLIPIVREPGATAASEMDAYLRAVPGLMQTPDGRRKIAEMYKAMSERTIDIARVYRNHAGSPTLFDELAKLDKPVFNEEQRNAVAAAGGAPEAAPAGAKKYIYVPGRGIVPEQ